MRGVGFVIGVAVDEVSGLAGFTTYAYRRDAGLVAVMNGFSYIHSYLVGREDGLASLGSATYRTLENSIEHDRYLLRHGCYGCSSS